MYRKESIDRLAVTVSKIIGAIARAQETLIATLASRGVITDAEADEIKGIVYRTIDDLKSATGADGEQ